MSKTTKKGCSPKRQPKKVAASDVHLQPTAEQIRKRSLMVQATWTQRERDKRAGVLVKGLDRPRLVTNYKLWAKVEQ